MKLFGPPATKWRPCKTFAKSNGNHFLMANIFKLHEHQTFGLMKMHNMSKIWFANNKFSLWKSLIMDYKGSYEILLRHNYFLSTHFWQWNDGPFNFFEICTETYFVSLLFLNQRNITTFLLMMHLKCTVVHYANLNSSSVNKPISNYGLLNVLFRFFSISCLCLI